LFGPLTRWKTFPKLFGGSDNQNEAFMEEVFSGRKRWRTMREGFFMLFQINFSWFPVILEVIKHAVFQEACHALEDVKPSVLTCYFDSIDSKQ